MSWESAYLYMVLDMVKMSLVFFGSGYFFHFLVPNHIVSHGYEYGASENTGGTT